MTQTANIDSTWHSYEVYVCNRLLQRNRHGNKFQCILYCNIRCNLSSTRNPNPDPKAYPNASWRLELELMWPLDRLEVTGRLTCAVSYHWCSRLCTALGISMVKVLTCRSIQIYVAMFDDTTFKVQRVRNVAHELSPSICILVAWLYACTMNIDDRSVHVFTDASGSLQSHDSLSAPRVTHRPRIVTMLVGRIASI